MSLAAYAQRCVNGFQQLISGKAPVCKHAHVTQRVPSRAEASIPSLPEQILLYTTMQIDRGRIWTFEQEQVGLWCGTPAWLCWQVQPS